MTSKKPFKLIVFRMSEELKTEFRVALMQSNVDLQHTMEAFADLFVAYVRFPKTRMPDAIKTIINRSQLLSKGV
jgi:hypothetical protein